MNEITDKLVYEKYIKEIPIEEQIKGQIRGQIHYMDKADIYEWLENDEIKIYNLQSKIDKAIEILNDGLKELDRRNRCEVYSEEYLENARDILKEDK